MSHLIQLKRRIKSIKTTEKLTHAMRLIAMSLYSKLDKKQASLQEYIQALQNLFIYLIRQCPEWNNPIFFTQDILDTTPLFIVVSSTKGFCGGLNNNLFRYLEQKLHIEEHQFPTFITIGKKATTFIEEKGLGDILVVYNDLNSNNFTDIAHNISKLIVQAKSKQKEAQYSSVTVYSTAFKNFFAQRPIIETVIPFTKEPIEKETEPFIEYEIPPIWEQNKFETINFVANRFLNTRLTTILFQALISEYASRFVAMDNATTNAEKYLESLTLQFNKLRQGLITREVSELSASL